VICGSYRQQVKQVGNATPALLGEVFGRAIASQVNGVCFSERPKLEIPRRSTVPPPAPVGPVSRKYLVLEGDHPPHPGPGLGPIPRKE
jgi:DNA (cytosine-5)-methyltransferase 1